MEYSCFVTVRLQLSLKYRPTPIVSETNANKNELTPARPVPSTGSNTRLLSSLSLTRLARRSDPDGAKPRTGEWWRRALGEPRAGVRHWTTLMLGVCGHRARLPRILRHWPSINAGYQGAFQPHISGSLREKTEDDRWFSLASARAPHPGHHLRRGQLARRLLPRPQLHLLGFSLRNRTKRK
jgi:hypothetical protein